MRLSVPVYQLKRRAKLLARGENIPLHQALNRIAREEGFGAWSALAARLTADSPGLLSRLADGDMVLLGARPGQGKTMTGLQLLLDAARDGRRAAFFTLEYTEQQAIDRIRSIGDATSDRVPEIVTSGDICADLIVRHLAGSPRGTVAVIDYLQILDQQRTKPPLSDQLRTLKAFAGESGVILVFLSQIDRSYDAGQRPLPGLHDIRQPNPIMPDKFSKACFIHAGEALLRRAG